MKICSFCQNKKEFSEFIKDRSQPDNYQQRCKLCRKYIISLKKIIPLLSAEEKTQLLLKLYIEYKQRPTQLYRIFDCEVKYIYKILRIYDLRRCEGNDGCGQIKQFSEFYPLSHSEDGYMRICIDCARTRSAEYSKVKYTNDPIHREYKKQMNSIWISDNYDRHRKLVDEYHKRHPEYSRHSHRKRQMDFKNRIPKWANLEKIKEIYHQARLLELSDGIPRHVDHIIPLQNPRVSGLHVENNLQILTASENLHKSNKF